MMDKQALRREIKAHIDALTTTEKLSISLRLCLRVSRMPLWKDAKTVLLYLALPDEVETDPLLKIAMDAGKRVVLPVVVGEELRLRYYEPQYLARSRYGILEPTAQAEEVLSPAMIDFALIPGRAFTRKGYRMGRGRGYYDRLLPRLSCPSYGICFFCQVVEDLPLDPWDKKLDGVIF